MISITDVQGQLRWQLYPLQRLRGAHYCPMGEDQSHQVARSYFHACGALRLRLQ